MWAMTPLVRTLSMAEAVEPVAGKVLGMVGLVVVHYTEEPVVVAEAGVMQRQRVAQAEHGVRMPQEAVEPLVHLARLAPLEAIMRLVLVTVLEALGETLMETVHQEEFLAAEEGVHLATMRQEMAARVEMESLGCGHIR
jgi:uncharacterized protein (AIM24 family)